MQIIETEHLILRPFREGDAADLFAYLRTPTAPCCAIMWSKTVLRISGIGVGLFVLSVLSGYIAMNLSLERDRIEVPVVIGDRDTDVQLAAHAIENQALLCSNDSDFARFDGLRWLNPLTEP